MKILKDENGQSYHLGNILGKGGQGSVWKVKENDNIVIKAKIDLNDNIIKDEVKYEKYKNRIKKIIATGEFKNVALPFAMLEKPYCGYLMRFMTGLHSIDNYMLPKLYYNKNGQITTEFNSNFKPVDRSNINVKYYYNETGGLSKRFKILINLAKIMYDFERHNVIYCDLSPANIYVSKRKNSYECWLIDTDNIRFANENKSIFGTPTYMAPEVQQGTPNTIYSDEYSFALVAYQLLFLLSPFSGSYTVDNEDEDDWNDDIDQQKANGDVAWIYEVNDDSNRCENSMDPNKVLTPKLFNLFERTFNREGRKNPKSRPSMLEWYKALIEANESIIEFNTKYPTDFDYDKRNSLCTESYCNEKLFDKKNIARYKVSIEELSYLSGEDESIYVPRLQHEIYWNCDSYKYKLSSYDILLESPLAYKPELLVIEKEENIIGETTFKLRKYSNEYDVIAVKDGNRLDEIDDISNIKLYIRKNGKYIKRIRIERS